MSHRSVSYRSTIDVELLGPTIKSTKTPIVSGTCTGRLYDPRAAINAAVDAASGASVLTLSKEPKVKAGDRVRIAQDDGTFHESLLNSIDANARTITLATITTAAVLSGARIERKLGSDISMLVFNAAAAVAFTKDWGFRGQVLVAHAGVTVDMAVHVESILDDGSGTIITKSEIWQFTDGV